MAYKQYVLICGGTGCESNKSDQVYRNLLGLLEKEGISSEIQVVKTGCFGFCQQGAMREGANRGVFLRAGDDKEA